ncbi:MAG: HDIG domain-containing protein [Candidatus Thermoplasmatota archaeon]|nr:HDIG domain-containing protein [Candidatus Thermoplasmatota archaeon]
MSIPDEKTCLMLLRQQGCSQKVISHCQAVRDVALAIAKRTKANKKLVEAGALLHDIGRSKTHGIFHAVEGAQIARELELPEVLALIIERHIGAGLPKEEAKRLGLPEKEYIPQTLEEKIVCHADNLIDNCHRQPIENEVDRALRGGHKEYAARLIALHKELSDLCGIDLDSV